VNSSSTVRIVIAALAVLAFTVVAGGIYLTAIDKSLPGELIAIGLAAPPPVAGILSKTGTDTMPVNVVNRPNDPVPVDGV
jgi:hypothetical protein